MHEVSLMEQTLEIALENARSQGGNKIHTVKMRIGTISGVVPEALEFAFEVVTEGTMAEGATLEIEIVPVVCHCPHCGANFEPDELFYECPQCGNFSNQILAGKEIELTSLEVS